MILFPGGWISTKRIVFGTSVQGASHIRSGTECQDSLLWVKLDDGTIIMAVADGHGSKSCPFSKTGSYIAVTVFCKIVAEYNESFFGTPERLLTYLNREGEMKVAQAIDLEWKKRVYKNHRDNNRDVPLNENGDENLPEIFAQYGTTLLGLMLKDDFLFAFQLGDGDIVFTSAEGVEPVLKGDKILGVETHSLSKEDAWKKAISAVRRIDSGQNLPSMFMMSTDGFANSYENEEAFAETCRDYFEMVNQYGVEAVNENLRNWLNETSSLGCGDDITVLLAYQYADEDAENSRSTVTNDTTVEENKPTAKDTQETMLN